MSFQMSPYASCEKICNLFVLRKIFQSFHVGKIPPSAYMPGYILEYIYSYIYSSIYIY